jgi:lipoate-protein ligase A
MVNGKALSQECRLLDLSWPSACKNLALEEALARSSKPDSGSTIRIWTNPRAVVVGRFQDVSAEVNVPLCCQNNIEIARRFTGGGTVFHDEGNLNFTVVTPRQTGIPLTKLNTTNCSVILRFLEKFGVEARFVRPNAIMISGKKISGAAAALGRDFTFWHASILISTDEQMLNAVLQRRRKEGISKFTQSKWQPTVTLQSVLGGHLKLEDAKRELICACEEAYATQLKVGELSTGEEQLAESLYAQKYSSREWNLQGICSQNDS